MTYFGKVRPVKEKIIHQHGLVGWVFKEKQQYSVLIVLPNDGDYSNSEENGERIFLNPLNSPHPLKANYIRYNKKDLYLLGRVTEQHIKTYCAEVDSGHVLYFVGLEEWKKGCPQSAVVESERASKLVKGWAVHSYFRGGKGSDFELKLEYRKQKLLFSQGEPQGTTDSTLLWIELRQGLTTSQTTSHLYLSPMTALEGGKKASDLILTRKERALGFLIEKDGRLLIKKLTLNDSV